LKAECFSNSAILQLFRNYSAIQLFNSSAILQLCLKAMLGSYASAIQKRVMQNSRGWGGCQIGVGMALASTSQPCPNAHLIAGIWDFAWASTSYSSNARLTLGIWDALVSWVFGNSRQPWDATNGVSWVPFVSPRTLLSPSFGCDFPPGLSELWDATQAVGASYEVCGLLFWCQSLDKSNFFCAIFPIPNISSKERLFC